MGYYKAGSEAINLMALMFNSADDMEGYTEWLAGCRKKIAEMENRPIEVSDKTVGESRNIGCNYLTVLSYQKV